MLVTDDSPTHPQVVGHSYIVYGPLIQGCATVPLGMKCSWTAGMPCMSGTLWRETSWPGPLLTNSHVSLKGSQGHHVERIWIGAIYWPLPIHLMMLMFVHVLYSLTRGTPDAGAFWRVIEDKTVDCCRKQMQVVWSHQCLMKELLCIPLNLSCELMF